MDFRRQVRITEEWVLNSKSNGTVFNFVIHHGTCGVFEHLFLDRLMRAGRVPGTVRQMLSQSKALAESGR